MVRPLEPVLCSFDAASEIYAIYKYIPVRSAQHFDCVRFSAGVDSRRSMNSIEQLLHMLYTYRTYDLRFRIFTTYIHTYIHINTYIYIPVHMYREYRG